MAVLHKTRNEVQPSTMTTCMHAKVHEDFFFLRYLQERHLLGRSRTQSMYFRQKDDDFQLH